MKVCLISIELFAWGKYGGFGRVARIIGGELVKRGVEVCVVTPRREGQKEIDQLDGMTVYGFSRYTPWKARTLIKACNADIYHSLEPSYITYQALRTMPGKKHIVTFQDPRDADDWRIELRNHSLSKIQVLANMMYEHNFLVKMAARNADAHYVAATCLSEKVKNIYKLKTDPVFLPSAPIIVPEVVRKAETPTVCFLARFDRRKRPELYFKLAKEFPHVIFIAVGKSRDQKYGQYLKEEYGALPNVQMKGFLNQFEGSALSDILSSCWIMINTACREGLPNAFVEALAHRCAILSHVNPEDFASKYGYCAADDDFKKGLEFLLKDDCWKTRGEQGHEYVKRHFALDLVIDKHIEIYTALLKKQRAAV